MLMPPIKPGETITQIKRSDLNHALNGIWNVLEVKPGWLLIQCKGKPAVWQNLQHIVYMTVTPKA